MMQTGKNVKDAFGNYLEKDSILNNGEHRTFHVPETQTNKFTADEFIIDEEEGLTDKPFFDVQPVVTSYSLSSTTAPTGDDVRSLCGYADGNAVLSCYIMVKRGEFFGGDVQIVLHDAYSEDEYHWFKHLSAATHEPGSGRKYYVINCPKNECKQGIYMGQQSLWAIRNLGSTGITEVGGYYQWAEVENKASASSFNYKNCHAIHVGPVGSTQNTWSNNCQGIIYCRNRNGHKIYFPKNFVKHSSDDKTGNFTEKNTAFMVWTRATLTAKAAIIMLYGFNNCRTGTTGKHYMSTINSTTKSFGLPIRPVYVTHQHMGPDGDVAYPWYHNNNFRGGLPLIPQNELDTAQSKEETPGDGKRDAYLDTWYPDPSRSIEN